jgi:polysaccharide biosynthesis/export protein
MKNILKISICALVLFTGCTSQQKLAYLSNLPETSGDGFFTMTIPEYLVQPRDVLYITAKALASDGLITDYLSQSRNLGGGNFMQGEVGPYLYGYEVNTAGDIILPVIGTIRVGGSQIDSARLSIQMAVDKVFKNTTVECKLLSFKFTVIGEVRTPGTYVNYNNYLNVLEAIGRAGGINDFGRRDKILIVRPVQGGTKTYTLNLQDKNILSSEAYFLLPNDVIIVEAEDKKIFNLNLPTYGFIITTASSLITTTLLLINYFGK